MPTTEPRGGLIFNWIQGEFGYGSAMNDNLTKISRVAIHPAIINRTTISPPTSPSDGDGYIVASAAVSTWIGQENNLAIYSSTDTAWIFYIPKNGYQVHDDNVNSFLQYRSSTWVDTLASTEITGGNISNTNISSATISEGTMTSTAVSKCAISSTPTIEVIGSAIFTSEIELSGLQNSAASTNTNRIYVSGNYIKLA